MRFESFLITTRASCTQKNTLYTKHAFVSLIIFPVTSKADRTFYVELYFSLPTDPLALMTELAVVSPKA